MKQSQFPLGQYAVHNCRFIDASLRKVGATLVVVGLVLSWWQTAMAQQDPSALQLHKAEIEVQKLELEVAKLKKELVDWHKGLTAFLGFLTGIAGTAFSFWAARRARAGAMDQATHEKRLECYPQLVQATSRLAAYFPSGDPAGMASLDPHECGAVGRAMSEWYFESNRSRARSDTPVPAGGTGSRCNRGFVRRVFGKTMQWSRTG